MGIFNKPIQTMLVSTCGRAERRVHLVENWSVGTELLTISSSMQVDEVISFPMATDAFPVRSECCRISI